MENVAPQTCRDASYAYVPVRVENSITYIAYNEYYDHLGPVPSFNGAVGDDDLETANKDGVDVEVGAGSGIIIV